MNIKDIQDSVLALPAREHSQLFRWVHKQEDDYGDVDSEAVAHIVSEAWEAEAK